ncbi:hypothetical protein HRW11_24560, partial [Streptomyces lunaelactis]|nr:hypothetical protein [Streptomyces lunaelactis]
GWTITLNIDEKRQKALVKAVDKQLEEKLERKGDKADATVQAGGTPGDPGNRPVVPVFGRLRGPQERPPHATPRDLANLIELVEGSTPR